VINQSLLAKEQNPSVDIFEIITEAPGRKIGFPVMQKI